MSYDAVTDFLAVLRQTSGGQRFARMPGLDYVLAAMARAGMFLLSVGQTAPTTNQAITVWLKPAPANSWAAESAVYLYNSVTAEYEPATPALWAAVLGGSGEVIQTVTAPGPANVQIDATIVLVNQAIAAPINLVMPPALVKNGAVLISDRKGDAGTNNITITLSGGDVLPGGLTTWTILADTGSIFLRPVPGGYVL